LPSDGDLGIQVSSVMIEVHVEVSEEKIKELKLEEHKLQKRLCVLQMSEE